MILNGSRAPMRFGNLEQENLEREYIFHIISGLEKLKPDLGSLSLFLLSHTSIS